MKTWIDEDDKMRDQQQQDPHHYHHHWKNTMDIFIKKDVNEERKAILEKSWLEMTWWPPKIDKFDLVIKIQERQNINKTKKTFETSTNPMKWK